MIRTPEFYVCEVCHRRIGTCLYRFRVGLGRTITEPGPHRSVCVECRQVALALNGGENYWKDEAIARYRAWEKEYGLRQ